MIHNKKFAAALLTAAVASTVFAGAAAPAQAEPEGNRVIVSGYNYENVRARCFDKQREYSSMRVRITQSCIYIGQNIGTQQHLSYGWAFWWAAS